MNQMSEKRPPEVLIVDDDPSSLDVLEAVLVGDGYRVVKASDGVEALEVARRRRPDVLISDVLMPRMDGYELCYELQHDPELARVPFIFYSSIYTDPEDQRLGLKLGAARFLLKPSAPEEIEAAVLDALEADLGSSDSKGPVDETTYLRSYGRRVMAKLHEKIGELEGVNARLRDEIRSRDEAEARVRDLAYFDHLTGLPNEVQVLERLSEVLESGDSRWALFVLDVDSFREINHSLGQRNGDELLVQLAARLRDLAAPRATVSRVGEDEFAVLQPGVADAEEARWFGRRLLDVFDDPFELDDVPVYVTASAGVSSFPLRGDSPARLLRHAKVAMHEAKRTRGGVALYDSSLDPFRPERLRLVSGIRQAIENRELVLYYQPKLALGDQRIVGAEALVRWQHPERGFLPPSAFIEVAEQTGQILALTRWLLRLALEQAAAWDREGRQLAVCMNLSARNLADEELPSFVDGLLGEIGISGLDFTVEITESAILRDPARARQILDRLAGMGFDVSIDDFGTGYSSLAYLKQLPVGELKIDKSFVTGMVENENDEAIVRSTIDLAHNLGLGVTAEGVEDRLTLDRLRGMSCDLAQGFYIGKPMPAAELEQVLDARTA